MAEDAAAVASEEEKKNWSKAKRRKIRRVQQQQKRQKKIETELALSTLAEEAKQFGHDTNSVEKAVKELKAEQNIEEEVRFRVTIVFMVSNYHVLGTEEAPGTGSTSTGETDKGPGEKGEQEGEAEEKDEKEQIGPRKS
jgi:hypothetical protein